MRPAHGFASRVVLLGSSGGDPSRRAAIADQLARAQSLLVDSVRWGLDEGNSFVLVDPESDADVRLTLKTAAEGVSRGGLLFVHYVGPVGLTSSGVLQLQFPDCTFSYEEIRYRLRFNGGTRRLVILDCRAAGVDAEAIAGVAFERGVLMVHAPGEVDDWRDFTGHIVDVLAEGQPHGQTMLGPQALRETFGGTLAIRPNGTADSFSLIRNPALFHADRAGQILLTAGGPTAGAVVLVVRYDREGGTLGVVLNRPTATPAATPSWPGASHDPGVVFDGGPVRHEGYIPLALLHAGAEPPPAFRRIGPDSDSRLGTLPLTTRPAERVVERFRLFRGYVGWGPGELEAEIADGSVVLGQVSLDDVLMVAPETLSQLAHGRG